jgi:hypothetical protein
MKSNIRQALDKMKYEIANELGVFITNSYNNEKSKQKISKNLEMRV